MSSQQHTSAKKQGKKQPDKDTKGAESSKATSSTGNKPKNEDKKKDTLLRPSTPPAQTGSRIHDDEGNSPASQACESGTVTPNSEGVWRKDRKKFHAPPAGELK